MKNKDYWQSRAVQQVVMSEKSVLDYEKQLTNTYELAIEEIRKEINSFFQKYSKNNKIPYSEVRRRLDNAERKSFNTLLKEWYRIAQEEGLSKNYSDYLKELGAKTYITRLESLEASAR